MAGLRQILFASDFSKASGKAFATAVTLAKASQASLTILHVVVPFMPIVPEQYVNTKVWDQIDTEARRRSRQQLGRLTERAKRAGVQATSLVAEGDPASQIIRAARAKHAGLLVIGTHGRTGLAKFFVGSVAGRVVATAPCPVVTVRAR